VAPGSRAYAAEYPSLWVPQTTQGQTTEILVILQLYVSAFVAGEWTVSVTLRPGAQPVEPHALPPARVAVVRQSWLPVVTGLNPKITYDTADRIEDGPPDRILDFLIQQSHGWRYSAMTPAEARASLASQQEQGHERSYKTWLHAVINRQKNLPASRLLDHPAIASNVAILRDCGQATLDLCRSHLEGWLRPLAGNGGELRLRAARQMTENLHVGKVRKTLPTEALLADKAWRNSSTTRRTTNPLSSSSSRRERNFRSPAWGEGLQNNRGERRRAVAGGAGGRGRSQSELFPPRVQGCHRRHAQRLRRSAACGEGPAGTGFGLQRHRSDLRRGF
jgi:hypothetical protein